MVGLKLGVWGRELNAGWRGIKVEAMKSFLDLFAYFRTLKSSKLAAWTSQRINLQRCIAQIGGPRQRLDRALVFVVSTVDCAASVSGLCCTEAGATRQCLAGPETWEKEVGTPPSAVEVGPKLN
jgi:hypothetical protein